MAHSPLDLLFRVSQAEVLQPAPNAAAQLLERLRVAQRRAGGGPAAAAAAAVVSPAAAVKPGLRILALRARFPASGSCTLANPNLARQSSMNTTVSLGPWATDVVYYC